MNYYIIYILNFSIFIAGIIALIGFPKISKVYYPFIFCVWIGCLNEVFSVILIKNGFQTTANNNVYVLSEALLLTWFFSNTGLFKSVKSLPYGIAGLFLLVWVLENFVWGNVAVNSTYFRIVYAFGIVMMSVSTISEIVLTPRKNILKNATFIICISFVLYFTFKVLIQAFLIYGLFKSKAFITNVYNIMTTINVLTNLLYALAVVWMPRRFAYIPQF